MQRPAAGVLLRAARALLPGSSEASGRWAAGAWPRSFSSSSSSDESGSSSSSSSSDDEDVSRAPAAAATPQTGAPQAAAGPSSSEASSSSSSSSSGSKTLGSVSSIVDSAMEATPELSVAAAAAASASAAAAAASAAAAPEPPEGARLDNLLRALLHPISRSRRWTSQLSPHLVHVNGQLLVEPQAVLTSMLRALHVVRGVLEEDGHVMVVETHPLLRPLLREAARSCINPNMWWMETPWSRGMIANAASHRRLFLPAHQPNRRLFMAKGLRMVNPHHPDPTGPPPRLSWEDKWALYARTGRPGYRELLETLLEAEHGLLTLKPPRTLQGRARDLRLLVVLDTTRNPIAIAEAAQRGIPTIALASGQVDMSSVTYPVLARDFSPEFVHFFLDMLVRVANVGPASGEQEQGVAEAAAA